MKTILVDTIHTYFKIGEGVQWDLHELLESYPNEKIAVTGANDEQIRQFQLANIPYPLFTLEHNPEKSSPKYFQTLSEIYGIDTTNFVYFDHDPKAVETAQSMGIPSFQFNPQTRNLNELKDFLDQNI